MSNVKLVLDSYQIYSGNIIRGKAVCQFYSSKEVRKIIIRLKGKESTSWSGEEWFSGNRTFLLENNIVHGEGVMAPGEYVYPFEFQLSEDIPSSFHHTYGQIRYSIKVTVDRPWKIDYESKAVITVISPIRIQQLPSNLLEPAELSDERIICCFCCATGLVQLDVTLEKRALVVGEYVAVKLYCLNMSDTNVDSLAADIKLKMSFKTTSPSTDHKYVSEKVCSSYNSGVGAHGEKTFNLRLEIPQTTVVPNFTGCELFHCDSRLKVTAAFFGCSSNLDVSTNVALAHVPLPQISPSTALPYQLNETQPITMPMPMPPPEYEAAVENAVGIPPYPVPANSPGPSAPEQVGAPSAPLKLDVAGNPFNIGAGNFSSSEFSPPTYDEAAKHFK